MRATTVHPVTEPCRRLRSRRMSGLGDGSKEPSAKVGVYECMAELSRWYHGVFIAHLVKQLSLLPCEPAEDSLDVTFALFWAVLSIESQNILSDLRVALRRCCARLMRLVRLLGGALPRLVTCKNIWP